MLYQRALAIKEQALGANHPAVALTLDNLAMLEDRRGDIAKALACSRKATAAVIAHGFAEAPTASQEGNPAGLVEQRAQYFLRHSPMLQLPRSRGSSLLPRWARNVSKWPIGRASLPPLLQRRLAHGVKQTQRSSRRE